MATGIDLELDEEVEITYAKKYKVYLLNDDYTTMDFVVEILMKIFHKSYDEAQRIMLQIHEQGQGLCGVYSYEIAETKVMQVHQSAKKSGFPLKATMEEE